MSPSSRRRVVVPVVAVLSLAVLGLPAAQGSLVATFTLGLGVPPAGFCEVSGPDAFGYTCQRVPYVWGDTSSNATTLNLTGQYLGPRIGLPFAFPWYGGVATSLRVGADGFVCFHEAGCQPGLAQGAGPAAAPPATPDPQGPNDLLACFWEDLAPTPARGFIKAATNGQAPNRVFVVEFNDVPHAGSNLSASFQFQLREDGRAACMYSYAADDGDGERTAVGTESLDGTAGVRYRWGMFAPNSVGVQFCIPSGPVGAPGSLVAVPTGVGQVGLSWGAPAGACPGVTHYNLYRGPPGAETFHAQLPDVTVWYDAVGGVGVTSYYVRPVNPFGEGPASPSASVVHAGLP